jgi:chromosome partitioning protein
MGSTLFPRHETSETDAVLSTNDLFFNRYTVLHEPLAKLRGKYDYIFLDTAPNTNVTTTLASYLVADYFIISTLPEKLALEGLKNALKDIAQAQRKDRNPQLKLLGVIVSRLDRRIRKAREYEEAIRKSFAANAQESRKFRTTITSSAIPLARRARPLQTEPEHGATQQFCYCTRA